MSRRRSTYSSAYSGYSRREKERRFPSPLPYFVIALLAAAGLGYFHFFAFKSLSGTISNAFTSLPMPGVTVTVTGGTSSAGIQPIQPAQSLTATTGPTG